MTDLPQLIVNRLREEPDPADRFGILTGSLLARTLGKLTDEEWIDIGLTVTVPCGAPDCSCENIRAKVFEAMDVLRTDFQEQTAH